MNNKVLVVGESKVILMIYSAIFESEGYKHEAAENATECIEKINKTEFGVVILNVEEPLLDGIETLKNIKSCQPNLPVIVTSMCRDEEFASDVLKNGAYRFIAKPFETTTMAKILGEML